MPDKNKKKYRERKIKKNFWWKAKISWGMGRS